jgi:hypothetical protein
MLLLRRSSIIPLALGVFTLIYLLNHYQPFNQKRKYLYGTTDPTLLYDVTKFSPGSPKSMGQNYTRTVVMGRMTNNTNEDTSWLDKHLPDLNKKIYLVDQPNSGLPTNKGHEAMVYLTYIIDHYTSLPDIVIFMHPHEATWHNNILLDLSSATTLKLLSDAHVMRQGYFNTRCHLDPGCPNWLHVDQPRYLHDMVHKPEESVLTSTIFHELFGKEVPIPKSLSQPCCAQFAVSGERIRQRSLDDYIHYRNWLLNTSLPDKYSGRIFEYAWQYLFSGRFSFCPSQHQCYCDGYGICFPGRDAGLKAWLDLLRDKELLDERLNKLWKQGEKVRMGNKYKKAQAERTRVGILLDDMREEAVRRGFDPETRARECGRVWKEGDEF